MLFAIVLFSVSVGALPVFQDTFEDGDYTANPTWEIAGNVTVDVGAKKNGSYGLQCVSAVGTAGEARTKVLYENMGHDYNAWVYASDATRTSPYIIRSGGGTIIAALSISADKFKYWTNSAYANFTATPTDATWYLLQIDHNKNSGTVSYYVYNSSRVLIEAQTNKPIANLNDANQIYIGAAVDDAASTSYWDDVTYAPAFIGNVKEMLIKNPKNELTDVAITPFSIRVQDASTQEYQMQTADKNLYWNPNSNKINIDINANGYFTRRYSFDSNTNINLLQPYLVSTALGIQTAITVLGSITSSGISGITIVSSKLINDADVNMESHITDSSGRALFSFYPGDNYTLRYYINGIIKKTEAFSATSSTYTTYLETPFEFPTIVPTPYSDINFQPSINYAIAKDNNFLDLNQLFDAHYKNIAMIDVNIFYGIIITDGNLYSDSNNKIVDRNWLHQDVNLNKPGFDFNSLLHVWIKIVFTDGNTQFIQKIYTVIPSPNIMNCDFTGSGRWNNQMILTCWATWRENVTVNFGNTLNNGSTTKTITSFLATLFAFLACIGLASTVGLDSTNAGFVFIGILGFFWLIQWVFPELFFLAVFVFIIILIMKATIWR